MTLNTEGENAHVILYKEFTDVNHYNNACSAVMTVNTACLAREMHMVKVKYV